MAIDFFDYKSYFLRKKFCKDEQKSCDDNTNEGEG